MPRNAEGIAAALEGERRMEFYRELLAAAPEDARPLPRSLNPAPGELLPSFPLRLSHRLRIAPKHLASHRGLLRPPATTFPARHLLQLDPDLARALARSFSKIAITKFAFHGRERLGALRAVGETLVIQVMHWDDEIRSAKGIAPQHVEISDAEVDEAVALMEAMGGVDIAQYKDRYREAMETIIRAKAEGTEPPRMEAPAEPAGKVVDLMAAPQDSVRAAKKSRGEETGDEAEVHEISGRPPPQKKTASKKTADKRTSTGGEEGGRKEVLEEEVGVVTSRSSRAPEANMRRRRRPAETGDPRRSAARRERGDHRRSRSDQRDPRHGAGQYRLGEVAPAAPPPPSRRSRRARLRGATWPLSR
ncbi:Ku protein [Streptomyces violaceusniger]|uniref:Ku protein n=1 Tax=Streptomyces violaceusniger TaxID=68280 RepID=UPI00368FB2A7